jgi:hypothetical protein
VRERRLSIIAPATTRPCEQNARVKSSKPKFKQTNSVCSAGPSTAVAAAAISSIAHT